MGSRIIKKRFIRDPIIIGYSTIIIEAMARNKSPNNVAINRIYKRIRAHLEGSRMVTFKHVLRTHNELADEFANQVVHRTEGTTRENKEIYHTSVP